ncbi:MAG: hypothetical protein ACRDHF_03410 [Tepidiformaceae bacterium]
MVLICAWCNRTLRRGTGPVSHGICDDCSRIVESRSVARWGRPLARKRRQPDLRIPLPGFGEALSLASAAG